MVPPPNKEPSWDRGVKAIAGRPLSTVITSPLGTVVEIIPLSSVRSSTACTFIGAPGIGVS